LSLFILFEILDGTESLYETQCLNSTLCENNILSETINYRKIGGHHRTLCKSLKIL